MSFHDATRDEKRPNSAKFSPSIWGDYFMPCASNDSLMEIMENSKESERIIELKKQVKNNIIHLDPFENPLEKLEFIDAIQRLGLSYYFEKEIDEVLERLHNNLRDHHHDDNLYVDALRFRLLRQQGYNIPCVLERLHNNLGDHHHDDNLYADALRFLLLRQQGYNIPCDVFNKYKNEIGKFKESLSSDIRGLLSLYEAAQLRVHGEEILDEALTFTTTHLESNAKTSQLSSPLLDQVNHALKHPIRKSLERREARHFISVYHQQASHNEHLLTLGILDFNLLQILYQKELSFITRWWNEFDYKSKQSFSRDRIVESYIWTLGVFFEAETSQIRLMTSKLIALLTIIDDIYDSFGTLEELELFTEAIERWDICVIDQLPEYMKLCYKKLLGFYTEVEEFTKDERSYCLSYAKKGLQIQVRAYFHEAKWLHQKHIPTLDEYMPVGFNNAGTFLLIVMAFIGTGDAVTKDSMDWIFSDPLPKIVRTMSIVGRVMNDIAYHKSEQRKSGHIVASAVECYMKQYGVTGEEAIEKLSQQVNDSWKDLNEELLNPTTIPMPLLMRVFSFVRAHHEMYREGDGFTHGTLLKDLIDSLIINPYTQP